MSNDRKEEPSRSYHRNLWLSKKFGRKSWV